MLKLTDIKKDYITGDTSVSALKGVNLEFRKSEFVAILGHSGCGKTTLLNIIGGLDKYTSGDLVINGKSTKDFDDADWDTYRNHSIGFIFQSYNLIPHQTVLSNVELALTLSGVSREERRARAIEALEKVGLGDQINKKPNQMSGGQMQRVAIARALVNNPDILLADEPTGALDSETSVQIMNLIKEIANDRLVIMVTHNPELAEEYANRIIRLKDGEVEGDTNPYVSEAKADEIITDKKAKKKKSMSFLTALSLSLNNLMTKKGRTFLTSFAGSIGIIGIALILAVSAGVNAYIKSVEESTMSSYPIEIHESTMDTMTLLGSFMEQNTIENREPNTVYSNDVMINVMNAFSKGITTNNLTAFKQHIESTSTIKDNATDIKYKYYAGLNTYTRVPLVDKDGNPVLDSSGNQAYTYRRNLSDMSELMSVITTGNLNSNASVINSSVWKEFVGNSEYIQSQYKVIEGGGRFPENENEVVLIVGKDLIISDYILYMLGIRDSQELRSYIISISDNNPDNDLTINPTKYSFNEILGYEFKVLSDSDRFKIDGDRITECTTGEIDQKLLSSDATTLKIVGIVTPSDESQSSSAIGSIGYLAPLMENMIDKSNASSVVEKQLSNTETNLYNGFPFAGFDFDTTKINAFIASNPQLSVLSNFIKTDEQFIDALKTYLGPEIEELLIPYGQSGNTVPYGGYTLANLGEITAALSAVESDYAKAFAGLIMMDANPMAGGNPQNLVNIVNSMIETKDYNDMLSELGYVNKENPTKILIYPKDFEAKDIISEEINNYNSSQKEEDKISYSDMVGVLMSSVTTIVNAISYVLIAFVAISLIVSSIMIGIITYISVLERTKEIGILRAIGASKKDVSSLFNAETMIIGFTSGLLGVVVTYLLCIPINLILHALTGIPNLNAILPINASVILVAISVALTLISGIIPSRSAAKKDPVVALRSE